MPNIANISNNILTDSGVATSSLQPTITLTTTGTSGASTLISNTLNIPNYGSALTGYVPTSRQLTINGTAYDLSADRTWSVGTVTSVAALTLGTTGTDLSSSVATGTTTPVITLNVPTASAANRGALSAADWSTFNTKVGGVTATTPLFSSGGSTPNLTIQQSSGSQAGYLSSTDWTTFNNKQASGNYITSLTGEATATGPGAAAVTLDNASVTAKILTGVNITGGTVLATDTMLTAFGKLQNQVNGLIGGSIYQGTWNASTNTPTLTSSVGTQGYYYIVSVAGTTNLDGITDWFVGDWAIFNGGVWQQVDNTDAVVSVNGQTGAVSLTTDNISEGVTNLYFTNTRARAALSFAAGSGAYNSTTGVITIPTNTSQLTNGANFITLASLSGTAPIQYNNTTGAISITQSGTASNGYLNSTDWNTFNNKQATLSLTTTGTSGAATLVGTTLNVPNYGSALTGYVPYTGATAAVNLGVYGISAVNALLQSANTAAVVDIFTLYNPSAASSGVRQRFQNGYGDLAAIKVSQRDNGALADDGQIEFQVASNAVLDTKLTILNTGVATFISSITATQGIFSNITSITNSDQSGARLVIANTTGGQSVNLIAGNPNVDNTGFSIAYGNTNMLRFASTGAASFYSTINATGDISGAYILGTYFNASQGNSENPTIGQIWTQNTTDNYLRKSTPAHFRSQVTDAYYPSLTGSGASGTWAISITGSSIFVSSPDGGRNPNTYPLPNTTARALSYNFSQAGYVTGATGNYAGVMTYAPWDGTSASTGDSSYQLAFCNFSGVNASGLPGLAIRNGINSGWNATWYQFWHTGNFTPGAYLPLAGGTLTGPLGGTSAVFSSTVTATQFTNTSQLAFLLNNSGANNDFRMGSASSAFRIVNAANTVALLNIDNGGASTFSSTISASNFSGSSSGTNTGDSTSVYARSQSNWNDAPSVIGNVVGLLAWKNYSNGHVIFDASASTSPSGTGISNTNPQNNWTGTYPTLMGWNGSGTYGVRVDSARIADSTSGSAATAGTVTHNASRTDAAWYNVGWFSGNPSPAYSCDAVQIQSSTGSVRANTYSDNLDLSYYLKPASFSNLKAIGTGSYVQYGTSVGSPSANFGNGRAYLYVHPTASGGIIMSFKISISTTWNYHPAFGFITADVSFYFDGTSLYQPTTTITSATGMARGGLGIGQPVLADGYVAIPIYSVNSNGVYAKLEGAPSFNYNSVSWGSWVSVAYPGAAVVSVPGDITVGGLTNLQGTGWFGGYGPGSGPGLALENLSTFARFAFWGLDFYDWNHGIQMTIDNNNVKVANTFLVGGNTGMGTNTPEQRLHVEGTIQLGNQENLAWAYDNGSYYNYITNTYNTTDGIMYRSGSWTSNADMICHSFETHNGGWQKKLVINQNGNIGLSNNTPDNRLYVGSGSGTPAFNKGITIQTSNGAYTSGDGGMLQFQNEDVITAGIRGVRASGWGSSLIFYVHNATAGNTFGTSFVPVLTLAETGAATFSSSVTATSFIGNASSATYLNSSNYIQQTGSTGSWNADFQNTPAGTARYGGDVGANGTNNPGGSWWIQQNFRHTNGSDYWGTQVAWGWEDNANRLATRNVTGGSFGGWVYYLNSNNYSGYAVPIGGATLTNIFYFQTNQGPYLGSLSSARLQVYNSNNESAFMSFHRGGYYAVNFGLDADNVMRIGGWSAAANRWQLDMSGNQTVAGTSTATGFFEGSDSRFKQLIQDDYRVVGVQNIKPKLYIKDGKEEVGYFAQDFQSILASAVSESKEGFLNLSYTQVHTAKIAIIEDEVDILKRRVAELEAKLN